MAEVGASAVSNNAGIVGIQVQSSTATITTGFNFSLLKLQTIAQLAAGIFITAAVVVAVGLGFTVFGLTVKPDYPISNPDFAETFKVSPVTIDVLRNDKDPRESNLTVVGVTSPLHGIATIIGRKFVKYTPNKYYSGFDYFNYTVSNDKYTASGEVTVKILNHAPETVPIEFEVFKNKRDIPLNLFKYKTQSGKSITDIDEDILTIVSFSTPKHGSAWTDGSIFYYTPNVNFNDVDFCNYTISDGNDTSSNTITLSVVNRGPVANSDEYVKQKNFLHNLDVLANDYDENDDPLTILSTSSCDVGGARVADDGVTVDYLPVVTVNDYTASFEYTISDGSTLTATTFVIITLKNTPPVAGSATVTVGKNSKNNVLPLSYSDVDPYETLEVEITPLPIGSFVLSVTTSTKDAIFLGDRYIVYKWNDYSLKYDAAQGMLGTDTVKYAVKDGAAVTYGTITVNVVNNAPVGVADSATCPKRKSVDINVIANDLDPNGDSLKIKSVGATLQGGSVVIKDNNHVTYTAPANGFVGDDEFTYTLQDIQTNAADELTSTAKVTVTVFNQPPVAQNDGPVVAHKNIALVVDVLANDSDPNDDAISIATFDATASKQGTVTKTTLNGRDALSFTGTIVAPGATDYETFSYTVKDEGNMVSGSATVSVKVVNDAPVANPDSANLHWNSSVIIPVLDNDSDANGDSLTIFSVTSASHGTVSISPNRKSISYIPELGYVGSDSFTYKAYDQTDASNDAVVTITVANEAPTARADTYDIHFTATGNLFDVLANDNDASGDAIQLVAVTAPSNGGSAQIVQQNGKSFIQYSPSGTFAGVSTFTYTITDWNLQHTATVTVNLGNTAPVANGDSVTLHWNSARWSSSPFVFNALSNDLDADSDPIRISSLASAAHGTISIVSATAGTVSFTSSNDWSGTQNVAYSISDGASTANSQISITLTNANQPSAPTITRTIHWRTAQAGITIPVLNSLQDGDGDDLTLSLTPATGFSKSADSKSIEFSRSQYTGDATFSYSVSDGLATAQGTGTVTVTNNVPVAAALTGTLPFAQRSVGIDFDVLAAATESDLLDVGLLTITNAGTSSNGATISIVGGKIRYVQNSGFTGLDVFTYSISDGKDSGSNTITVNNIPQPLDTIEKSYSVHWKSVIGGGFTANVLQGVPGVDLKLWSITTTPSYGTSVIDGTQTQLIYSQSPASTGTFVTFLKYGDSVSNTKDLNAYITVTNAVPVAPAKSYTYKWNQLVQVSGVQQDMLAGSSDADAADSGQLTVSAPLSTSKATLSRIGGVVTYRANAGFKGTDSYQATVTDGLATVTVQVSITSTNALPSLVAHSYNIHWTAHRDGTHFNVLSGATDADSDTMVLQSVSNAADSTAGQVTRTNNTHVLVMAQSGSTFVNKQTSFSYVVSDGLETSSKTVTLNVYNTAPTCNSPQGQTRVWNTAQSGFLVANVVNFCNDADAADAANLQISGISSTSGAIITISGDKKGFTYKPPANRAFADTFRITVTDGKASATLDYTVTLTNNAPVISSSSHQTLWRSFVDIPKTCSDADSDSLTYSFVSPSQGAFAWTSAPSGRYTPGSVVYTLTPAPDGKHKVVDTFTISCSDVITSSTATISVTVYNTPPPANTMTFTTPHTYGTLTPITLNYVSQLAPDADGDTVTLVSASTTSGAVVSVANSQSISYTPTSSSFVGTDTVKVKVTDGNLNSEGNIAITYTNAAPVCNDITLSNVVKTVSTSASFASLSPCTDANNDPLTYTVVANSCSKGTIAAVTTSGVVTGFVYTSNTRRSGSDSCQFIVTDGHSDPITKNIAITINNRAPNVPTAKNFAFNRVGSTPVSNTLAVMTSTSDPDNGDGLVLTGTQNPNSCLSAAGSVSVSGSNLIYNQAVGWSGSCTFNYVFRDNDNDNQLTQTGTVTVTATAHNPVATDDLFTQDNSPSGSTGGLWSVPISSLLSNDVDVDSIGFSFTSFSCPPGDSSFCKRTPYLTNGNTFIALPADTSKCDTVKFHYTITSTDGVTSTATVTVKYSNCVCNQPVDLMFVLDGSGSVSDENWVRSRDFVKNIVSKFTLGESLTKVGVVQFSSIVRMDTNYGFALTSSSSVPTLIDGLRQAKGSTATILGLQKAKSELVNTGRSGVRKVVVIFTDGAANVPCSCRSCRDNLGSEDACKNPQYWGTDTCSDCSGTSTTKYCMPCAEPRTYAQNSINAVSGYRVVAIGVGSGTSPLPALAWQQVQGMAYSPDAAFLIDWSQTEAIYQKIVDTTCNTT